MRCDDGNATGNNCRGFIEATYTSDGVHASNVTFFEYYQSNTDPPFSHVNRNTSADGEELLSQVHERLITQHATELKAAGLYDKAVAERPTNALLSMWDPKSPGFGAGTHGMNSAMIPGGKYAVRTSTLAAHVADSPMARILSMKRSLIEWLKHTQLAEQLFVAQAGAAAGTVAAKSIKPFPTLDLYIANEAFHPADWGEGSLEMAENVVHRYFGVAPPRWMRSDVYQEIMFGNADAPSPAPGPPSPAPPGPGPAPAPPSPAGTCPAQTKLNASTVCAKSVDKMDCKIDFSCPAGEHFVSVDFASIGSPGGTCGKFTESASCHGVEATTSAVVGKLCLGKSACSVAPNTAVLNPANPNICDGVVKSTAIQLSCGKGAPRPPPPAPTPAPAPPSNTSSCAGPFGKDLPPLLQNRCAASPPDHM